MASYGHFRILRDRQINLICPACGCSFETRRSSYARRRRENGGKPLCCSMACRKVIWRTEKHQGESATHSPGGSRG